MDKLKQWVALTVVGVLAIGAASWFLLVSPKRGEAADLKAETASAEADSRQLQTQLSVMKALAKDLPKAQAELAAVAAKIPDNPALPSLIRALTKAADEAGVELVSLAPGKPAAVATTPVAPQAPAGGSAPVSTGTTAAATGTAVARPAAAAGASSAAAGSLQSIGLSIQVVGRYFAVEQFFDRVEELTRALKVTTFTMAPGSSPVKKVATATTSSAASTPDTLTTMITGSVYFATGRQTTAAAPAAPVN